MERLLVICTTEFMCMYNTKICRLDNKNKDNKKCRYARPE